jgi:hypothetical protein
MAVGKYMAPTSYNLDATFAREVQKLETSAPTPLLPLLYNIPDTLPATPYMGTSQR